jgi:arylsulfatase A-like enzyme
MADRPNILLLVNDHQAYYRHGWDGGTRPLTPHFDQLAAEGIRFERSYAAVPLCGPSRRTLVTGLYPHNHGNYYNYTNSEYDHEVYLETLVQAEYRCFYNGKWHAGPGSPKDFGCEGVCKTDYGNPYIMPEYHAYLEERSLPPAEHHVEMVFMSDAVKASFPRIKEGEPYRCDRHWCGEDAVGLTVTPKETHESFFLAHTACEQLEEWAQSEERPPFHMRVDFWGPHHPHFPTQEFAELYDPATIEEYGSFRDTLEGKPDYYWHEGRYLLSENGGRLVVPSPLPWETWQKIMARAYAHITMIDAAGGLILEKLDELGLRENTLVIWTTDHGDALASHGGRFDKGAYMTEEVLRVPLAMRFPGRIEPGQVSNALVCGTDIAPTLLDAAGTAFESPVDGQSLLPLAAGEADEWRDSLLVETYGHGYGLTHVGRGILKGRYKYLIYQDHLGELYDLEADPYEMTNLIHDPRYGEVLAELEEALRAWQRRTGDEDFDRPLPAEFAEEDRRKLEELLQRRAMVP